MDISIAVVNTSSLNNEKFSGEPNWQSRILTRSTLTAHLYCRTAAGLWSDWLFIKAWAALDRGHPAWLLYL